MPHLISVILINLLWVRPHAKSVLLISYHAVAMWGSAPAEMAISENWDLKRSHHFHLLYLHSFHRVQCLSITCSHGVAETL